MPFRRIACLIALTLPPTLSIADAYPVNAGIDIIHYRFELNLSDPSGRLAAKADIQAKFLADGLRRLRLDLVNRSDERDGHGMVVSAVTRAGSPLAFRHENDVLWVDLPGPSEANEVFEFRVEYAGVPHTGLIIKENKHGELTAFSDNWPDKARHWLPTVDHISDKATSEMLVIAPQQWQVVSNGLLVEESGLGNGLRLTHWRQSVPIAPWLYVLAAADFAVQYVDEFDHKAIQTWVYRQDRDAGFYDFAVPTRQVLEFMSGHVGPFVYEKLANIQANSVGGGMEAASAILYSDESVTGERTARWRYVITHEIAHQWFGNSVTEASWDDVWLSEGFATYFSYLFFEYADGHDAFVADMKEIRNKVFEFYREQPDYRIVHDNLADMRDVTTGQTYNKGAWILHMLRHRVGEDAWWRGIRNYYRKYMNSHANTSNFRFEMESACGCDLDDFFDQWLYQGGNVRIAGTWYYDPGAGNIEVFLQQVQDDGYEFTVDVEIGVYDGSDGMPAIDSVTLGPQGGRLSIPIAGRPARVELDPRTVLLAEWTLSEEPQ